VRSQGPGRQRAIETPKGAKPLDRIMCGTTRVAASVADPAPAECPVPPQGGTGHSGNSLSAPCGPYHLVSLRGEISAQMMKAFMATRTIDQSG